MKQLRKEVKKEKKCHDGGLKAVNYWAASNQPWIGKSLTNDKLLRNLILLVVV